MKLVSNKKIVAVMLMENGLKMVMRPFRDIAISDAVVKITNSHVATSHAKIIMNVFQLMNDPILVFVEK